MRELHLHLRPRLSLRRACVRDVMTTMAARLSGVPRADRKRGRTPDQSQDLSLNRRVGQSQDANRAPNRRGRSRGRNIDLSHALSRVPNHALSRDRSRGRNPDRSLDKNQGRNPDLSLSLSRVLSLDRNLGRTRRRSVNRRRQRAKRDQSRRRHVSAATMRRDRQGAANPNISQAVRSLTSG